MKSHLMHFYGADLWFQSKNTKAIEKKFAVGYHKAFKKVNGDSFYNSNHETCDSLNVLMFNHYVNWLMIKLAFRVVKFDNVLMLKLKSFFLKKSVFIKNVIQLGEKYDIISIFDNDIDAIHARIQYVQSTVERSHNNVNE